MHTCTEPISPVSFLVQWVWVEANLSLCLGHCDYRPLNRHIFQSCCHCSYLCMTDLHQRSCPLHPSGQVFSDQWARILLKCEECLGFYFMHWPGVKIAPIYCKLKTKPPPPIWMQPVKRLLKMLEDPPGIRTRPLTYHYIFCRCQSQYCSLHSDLQRN